MNPPLNKKIAVLLAIMVFTGASCLQASVDPFPVPEVIAPNVAFWTKVYTQYTTSQGIVHDNADLNRIYEVIDLLPYDEPGASKTNRLRMKRANEKYENILRRLATTPNTTDAQCRRVAELFKKQDTQTFKSAARRVRCQLGQKDRFHAGLIRSGAYIHQIRDIFQAKGLPADLAYLPHVESSFNPNAYSKFGAAGMWQFTRSTGKRFMEVGYALDERRDPILATYAAAELLKENYEKLGSWDLAITAYNHGAAGMQRAKNIHGDYSEIFQSYQSQTFKFASRNFYSEFLAARQAATNYQTYFGDIRLDRPVPSQSVILPGYAAIDDISRYLQVDPETIRHLNPALRQPVFDGQKLIPKGYRLRLPSSQGADDTLVAAAIPASIYKTAQNPSKFYRVERGDTAGKIARVHGIKLEELILANNLDRRATVYPRQTLRIPLPGEHLKEPEAPISAPSEPLLVAKAAPPVNQPAAEASGPESKASDTASEEDIKEIDPARMAPAPSEQEDDKDELQGEEAIAQTQEAAVAHTDDTAPAEAPAQDPPKIDETPSMAKGTAEPEDASDTVKYPQPVLASVIPLTPLESSSPLGTNPEAIALQARNEKIVSADVEFERLLVIDGRPVGIIRVEVEETLGHYAEWANVRTQQIRNLNKLRFGTVLRLHQSIKIPLHRTSSEEFTQNRYEYHKRLQEDFFAVYRIGELQAYLVQRGDNYWTLCQEKFDIPMWLLKHCNPDTDLADLHIRQQLIIPIVEKRSDQDATPDISGAEETPEEKTMVQADGGI